MIMQETCGADAPVRRPRPDYSTTITALRFTERRLLNDDYCTTSWNVAEADAVPDVPFTTML